MTGREKFLFDLNGYLLVENVLTPDEVAAANMVIDAHAHLIANREPGLCDGAVAFTGRAGRGEFHENPLAFEPPHCDPFRRMFAHPKLIDLFNEVLGEGFRLDQEPLLIRMDKDTEGFRLHGGTTFDPSQYHGFDHENMHCGLCVAAWQLTDVNEGDGGFACIPGSHKANYRPPDEVLRLEQDWGIVRQIVAAAGSLLIFNEALIHGTLRWQPADRQRRSLLIKYSPGYIAFGLAAHACPIKNPTTAERALYEPPSRVGRTPLKGEE